MSSGVAFPDQAPDAEVSVEAQFLESGNQLQQVFIGLEPVLLIQPEYDADENEIRFVTTAVDLDPKGLLRIAEILRDAAEEMARIQEVQEQEMAEADAGLRAASAEFEEGVRDGDNS